MTETTPASGDPAPRPLLLDSGWDREACGQADYEACNVAIRQVGGPGFGRHTYWEDLSEESREHHRVEGVWMAEKVRHALAVRLAQELNGGQP